MATARRHDLIGTASMRYGPTLLSAVAEAMAGTTVEMQGEVQAVAAFPTDSALGSPVGSSANLPIDCMQSTGSILPNSTLTCFRISGSYVKLSAVQKHTSTQW